MNAKLPYPLAMLQRGESHDPFAVLGRQPDDGGALVRAFLGPTVYDRILAVNMVFS